ncbi:zinc ribbon domain-containing protein, partial [Tsukamurella sputi]|uniref:zinc ribbon domain-containing protein n=1 Tax=Tsukamurella sputi TaxID=2591848 RepID=UPI0027B9A725
MAKGNGENTKRYQNRYSLSGKIKCGECGSSFKRRHHYNGKDKYIAWTCSEHLRDIHKCSMKFIKDKDIKLAFMTLVNKLVFGKDNILTPLLESLKRLDSKEEVEKIEKIEEGLEKLKERKEVLSKLITSGVLDASIYAK